MPDRQALTDYDEDADRLPRTVARAAACWAMFALGIAGLAAGSLAGAVIVSTDDGAVQLVATGMTVESCLLVCAVFSLLSAGFGLMCWRTRRGAWRDLRGCALISLGAGAAFVIAPLQSAIDGPGRNNPALSWVIAGTFIMLYAVPALAGALLALHGRRAYLSWRATRTALAGRGHG